MSDLSPIGEHADGDCRGFPLCGECRRERRQWELESKINRAKNDVAEAAVAVVASWGSSTYHHDAPGKLDVRVDRELWPDFAEKVERLAALASLTGAQ